MRWRIKNARFLCREYTTGMEKLHIVTSSDGTILNVTGSTPEPAEPRQPAEGLDHEVKWSAKLTSSVARNLRRWREHLGLSAQQLADRTRELGFHVPRSVIANLENGRRETLSIAEFLVIAAALDVPPVLLIADVGREETVEILPGNSVSTWLARGWILGAADPVRYNSLDASQWIKARRSIALYDIHKSLVREHQQVRSRIKSLAEQAGSRVDRGDLILAADENEPLGTAFTELAYSLDRIRAHRELIEKEGFLLPALPAIVSAELLDATQTGRHNAGGRNGNRSANLLEADSELERPVFYDSLAAAHRETLDDDPNA